MKSYKLKFYGPLKFGQCKNSLFNHKLANKKGIYLWTIPFENKYYIEYIGETGQSFYKRNKEHLIQVMGGNYRVIDMDSLKTGNVNILWNGMWRKGTRDKMNEFINLYVDLAPKLLYYITSVNVFIAPLDCDTRIRRRIEGSIAKYIKEQPSNINKFFPKDVRYWKIKDDEEPICIQINYPKLIVGLPNEIIA